MSVKPQSQQNHLLAALSPDGVRRSGVTKAASRLQELGVFSYSRGLIKVLDRPQLESLSCECYGVVKKETDLLLPYLPQRAATTNSDAISTVAIGTP